MNTGPCNHVGGSDKQMARNERLMWREELRRWFRGFLSVCLSFYYETDFLVPNEKRISFL